MTCRPLTLHRTCTSYLKTTAFAAVLLLFRFASLSLYLRGTAGQAEGSGGPRRGLTGTPCPDAARRAFLNSLRDVARMTPRQVPRFDKNRSSTQKRAVRRQSRRRRERLEEKSYSAKPLLAQSVGDFVAGASLQRSDVLKCITDGHAGFRASKIREGVTHGR